MCFSPNYSGPFTILKLDVCKLSFPWYRCWFSHVALFFGDFVRLNAFCLDEFSSK